MFANPKPILEGLGPRYDLIASPRAVSRLGTPLVFPIAQGENLAPDHSFAVSLSCTNVQKRLVAMHHLDAPRKPAEVEHREAGDLR